MTDLQYIQMVADADTPSGAAQWDGQIVGIPFEYIPGLGSGPDDTGRLLGVDGYPRAGGPTGTQFVMTPALDNVTRDFIRDIPSPEIWKDTNQRQVYRQTARALIRDHGVGAADVRGFLKQLYDAAVANDRTP